MSSEERKAIVARMRQIAETTDPTRPWQSKKDTARILLAVATIIEMEGEPQEVETSSASREAGIIARMFVAKMRNEGAQFERSTLLIAGELADILDGFRTADMTAGELSDGDGPFVVGDRVRMRSAELHALRGVGTIRALFDGDSAMVGWDAPGGSTTVFHADIRRAVER